MTALRLSIHVIAASVWVGGQLVLAGLVPTIRELGTDAPARVARAFGRIAWPALGLTVLTGLWNVMAIPMNDLPHPWVELHVLAVLLSAAGAFAHTQATRVGARTTNDAIRTAMLGGGGAVAALGSVAAMYLGVMITTTAG